MIMSGLPPGMSQFDLFPQGSAPKSPEQEAYEKQLSDLQEQINELDREQRRTVLAHAWLLCTCRKWFDRADPAAPPQAGCIVHANIMITRDGEIL
jgi:hypothetical protein